MLKGIWSCRYLLIALVVVVAAGMAVREVSLDWVRREAANSHVRHMAALSEQDAAAYLQRLDQDDAWLELLVQALADRRPKVAATAAAALDQNLETWRSLSSEASTPQVLRLSSLLAAKASAMPPEGQRHAQTLAESLLLWPVDVRHPDSPQLMLNCDVVLRLETAPMADIRVAALEQGIPLRPASLPAAEPLAGPELEEPTVAGAPAPQRMGLAPIAPAPFVDGTIQLPEEPKQFLPARGIRISDE